MQPRLVFMKSMMVSAALLASSAYAAPFTVQHTVGDLLAAPAFAPFAASYLFLKIRLRQKERLGLAWPVWRG